ncbi:uncharacterized protein LOC107484945 [Arachis duranensis]|uniref:Uncharacterized protein LOC107484945 n=1 Tax=Arachis duranensis TaxID=130453 RepID=A0A6P4D521_ARADU|nr:uncharacterized protein LOC107484945 [Arachis duranensis]
MVNKFLERFYPPQRVNRMRAEVQTLRKQDGKSLYEVWERYKDLTRRSPPGGSLNKKKIIEEAIDIIETVANNKFFYASDKSNNRRVMKLNHMDVLLAQNKMITKQLADLTKQMERNQVAVVTTPPPAQEGVHTGEGGDCEQANYVGNSSKQSYDPYSKTYNPGWKNHPNFRWENQQDQGQDHRYHNPNQNNNAAYQHSTQKPYQHPPNNYSQYPYQTQNDHCQPSNLNSPSSFEDRLSRIETLLEGICKEVQDNRVFKDEVRANIKNQRDTIKRLESQVGYLSQQIPKPTDGFPSETEKNPRGETKKVRCEECKMITIRDEEELKVVNNPLGHPQGVPKKNQEEKDQETDSTQKKGANGEGDFETICTQIPIPPKSQGWCKGKIILKDMFASLHEMKKGLDGIDGTNQEERFSHFKKGTSHMSSNRVPWEVLLCNIEGRMPLETEPTTS